MDAVSSATAWDIIPVLELMTSPAATPMNMRVAPQSILLRILNLLFEFFECIVNENSYCHNFTATYVNFFAMVWI